MYTYASSMMLYSSTPAGGSFALCFKRIHNITQIIQQGFIRKCLNAAFLLLMTRLPIIRFCTLDNVINDKCQTAGRIRVLLTSTVIDHHYRFKVFLTKSVLAIMTQNQEKHVLGGMHRRRVKISSSFVFGSFLMYVETRLLLYKSCLKNKIKLYL